MDTTKILAINAFIFMIPIMALVYTTTINSGIQENNKKIGCNNNDGTHIKMFDSQIVPKYIIGKDYKVIPVNPTTTDVLMNRCSLAAEGISQ